MRWILNFVKRATLVTIHHATLPTMSSLKKRKRMDLCAVAVPETLEPRSRRKTGYFDPSSGPASKWQSDIDNEKVRYSAWTKDLLTSHGRLVKQSASVQLLFPHPAQEQESAVANVLGPTNKNPAVETLPNAAVIVPQESRTDVRLSSEDPTGNEGQESPETLRVSNVSKDGRESRAIKLVVARFAFPVVGTLVMVAVLLSFTVLIIAVPFPLTWMRDDVVEKVIESVLRVSGILFDVFKYGVAIVVIPLSLLHNGQTLDFALLLMFVYLIVRLIRWFRERGG